jgi:multiple sugar transport system permease protein
MTTEALPLAPNKVAVRKLIVFGCFLVTAVTLIPVVMMVLVAFQSDAESMAAKPSFWPSSWHPENLTRAFDLVPLGKYLLNTVYFAAGTTLLETVTAALAAYAFARLNFPGRSWLFGIYLATLMIPSQVTLIPQFVLVAKLHGIDTWPGMILPHAFTAIGVFLLRQFFLGIPRDYEEAARLDGANRWQSFWNVTVPLLRPALGLVLILSVTGSLLAFDQFFILTKGGPDNSTVTVVQLIYREAFQRFDLGAAAAISVVVLAALVVINIGQLRALRKDT